MFEGAGHSICLTRCVDAVKEEHWTRWWDSMYLDGRSPFLARMNEASWLIGAESQFLRLVNLITGVAATEKAKDITEHFLHEVLFFLSPLELMTRWGPQRRDRRLYRAVITLFTHGTARCRIYQVLHSLLCLTELAQPHFIQISKIEVFVVRGGNSIFSLIWISRLIFLFWRDDILMQNTGHWICLCITETHSDIVRVVCYRVNLCLKVLETREVSFR